MSLIVQTSDFKGSVSISQNQDTRNELQDYLDEDDQALETGLLEDLLGCELATLFIADLVDGVPVEQRFLDIFNKFCEDIDSPVIFPHWNYTQDYYGTYCYNGQNKSRGIKAMLKGLIYTLYVRDQQTMNTPAGGAKSDGVASTLVPATTLAKPYNRSINDYWNIQYFIVKNEDTYPEFNGIKQEIISMI